MKREYHKWLSPVLGREMELLVFGHAGIPALVFPTSCGRFFEFEDRGMINAVNEKLEQGHLQLFCVDSIDAESWYNRAASPPQRIARHLQYEQYLLQEVVPMIRQGNHTQNLSAIGCSFGGYHALNLALRHPDVVSGVLSMGGAFDLSSFLSGYYDDDCYFNSPMHYLPNLNDPWYLDRYRHNTYVLATGVHDKCWNQNERMAQIFRDKAIPCRLDVWGDGADHDWSWWRRMLTAYLSC
jgi:esterase/lipase superfamily enzyme